MARIARWFGYVLLALATLLAPIGVSTWPPGGLMFALPFVFPLPAAVLALIGGVLVWLGRRRAPEATGPEGPSRSDGGI